MQVFQENRASKNTLLFNQLQQLNILVLYVTAVHKQPRTKFCWLSRVEKLTDSSADVLLGQLHRSQPSFGNSDHL